MKKKLSIIIPVYNASSTIERCIESILEQTILDYIEVIFVNDGSTDDSTKIIEKYLIEFPDTFVLINQENSGPSIARNNGINHAKGEYIGFIDSDDYISKDMYSKMVNLIESDEDIDLVLTGRVNVTDAKEKEIINYTLETGMSLCENPKVLSAMSGFVWDKLYKLDIIRNHNISFPENLHYAEDLYFVTIYKYYSKKIGVLHEANYYYITQSTASITNTCNEKWLDITKTLKLINNFFMEKGIFDQYQNYLLRISMGYFCRRVKAFKNSSNKKVQLQFVKEFYQYFDYYFENWKKSLKYYGSKKPKNYRVSYHKMKLFIYTPNFMKKILIKFFQIYGKMKTGKVFYAYCRKFVKTKENKVLFMSYYGGNITDSPYYMMKDLLKDNRFEVYVASRNIGKDRRYLDFNGIKNVKIVKVHSKEFIKLLSSARYIINNSRVPEYFVKKKNQILVNTWHGTPLKTLGRRMNKGLSDLGNNQNQFVMSDYLLYPNNYTKNHIMRDFFLEHLFSGKVILSGYPRCEIFFDEIRRKQLRKKLEIDNKKVYVYMPTWRGNTIDSTNIEKYKKELEDILTQLDYQIKDAVIYVKLHQIVMKHIKISNYKNIKPIHSYYETYDFLNIADCLITDYSSVFFDFANTKREIILFMYDYDQYIQDRGVYYNIEKLPFTKVYNINELIKRINLKSRYRITKKYQQFLDEFCNYDGEDNSTVVNDIIFRDKKSDRLIDYGYNSSKKYKVIFCTNLDNQKKQAQFDQLLGTIDEETLLVFKQKSFKDITNDYIHKNDYRINNYMVIPEKTPFTISDKVLITLYRKTSLFKKFVRKIYLKELSRILPGIHISSIENYTGDKRFQDIKKLFDGGYL